ncbi:MAG: sulfatase [Polyangiaceae bacterium]
MTPGRPLVMKSTPRPSLFRRFARTLAWGSLCLGALACSNSGAHAIEPGGDAVNALTLAGRDGAAPDGANAATAAPKGPPANLNLLLITVDSLRADMPWAGYDRPIAPNLTEFEKRAVSYTQFYSLSSYTSMSLGGLLGGRYPGEMKRDGSFFGRYRDNKMFPERLQAAGVKTMAAHAHGYFRKGAAGFDKGFDIYELVPNLKWNPTTDENITGPAHEKIAERMLGDSANTSGRWFAWFHFLDPHDQYMRHPDIKLFGKKARDLYDGEVTFTDRYIGQLLEFISKQPYADRTAVIVSADHGEAFGEHGCFRHAFELWQPLIRVPLMMMVPGATARRIDLNRSAIDLAPTILELMGIAPEGLDGVSLVPELFGKDPEARDVIVDLPRTSNSDRRRAIIQDHYKVIAYGDDSYYQVFDLDADPTESKSLEKSDKAKYAEMVALYKSKKKDIKDIGPYACRTLKGAPPGRAY